MIRRSMIWGSLLSSCLACATGSAQQMAPAYGVHGNSTYIPPTGWQNPPAHPPHAGWEQPGLPYSPELLPDDHGFLYDLDSPIDLDIRETLAGMGFRFEYLNWQVKQAHNTLFGAPLQGVPDPNEPFDVSLNNNLIDTAFVPDLEDVGSWSNQDGFKGTVVIPILTGAVESSWWILTDGTSRFATHNDADVANPNRARGTNILRPDPAFLDPTPNPIITPNPVDKPGFIALSLLSDGAPGDIVLLNDEATIDYRNQVWSGDVNYYHVMTTVPSGWKVEPSIGFRYMSYNELVDQNFLFDNRRSLEDPNRDPLDPAAQRLTGANVIRSRIATETQNDLYGGQVGIRMGMQSKYLSLQVEPRLIMGVNNWGASVRTENLRDSIAAPGQTDGVVTSRIKKVALWPGLDLGVKSQIHLTDWANLTVGYNLFVTGNIARAPYATYYNDLGTANPPAVVAKRSQEELVIHGLSLGMEFFLP